MSKPNSGTLLIFLKAPVPGQVKTRLAADIGTHKAATLYLWMAGRVREETDQLARGSIRRLWVYAPAPEFPDLAWLGLSHTTPWHQSSGNLGWRLRSAFDRAFREGRGPVCVIGTDSPTLKAARIRTAFRLLRNHEVVLGPTQDGGYYLLGMRRFHPKLLQGIPWSTPQALNETLRRAQEENCKPHLLAPERDVDTLEDWKAVAKLITTDPGPVAKLAI